MLRRSDRLDPALGRRIGASVVLGVMAIADVALGGWFFAVLLLVAVVLMASEWARLIGVVSPAVMRLVLGATVAVPTVAIVLTMQGNAHQALLVLAGGSAAAGGLAALVPEAPVHRTAGGVLYIGLPTVALLWLRNEAEDGTALVLWLFFVVWATDIFAYLAGRAIGGPRLAPRISPRKTWAGLLGGVSAAILVAAVFTFLRDGAVGQAAAIAVVLAVVAQLGDLFESWMKRRVNIKDTGDLIPGHGGLLDRVDGLIFAAPVFALLLLLMPPVRL